VVLKKGTVMAIVINMYAKLQWIECSGKEKHFTTFHHSAAKAY